MKDKEVIDILGFGFLGSDDSVIQLLCDGLTKIHFEDSYTNVGNFGGTPSESIKFSANDKRTYVFEFLQELFNSYKQKVQRIVELEEQEKQALKYCYEKGFNWNGLYEHFDRLSCWCCPLKNLKELKMLYKYYPGLWAELKEMDNKSYNKFRADYSVLELEEKFKSEVE